MAQAYELKVGMNWKAKDTDEDEIRAEAGEIRDDLRPESIEWLEKGGYIEKTDKPVTKKKGGK